MTASGRIEARTCVATNVMFSFSMAGLTSNRHTGIQWVKMKRTEMNPEWIKKWPCIQPCSNYKFTCTICQCAVSCEHQGDKDVRRHISDCEWLSTECIPDAPDSPYI